MYTGRQVKEMINKYISDDDIICVGQEGDKIGRFDCQITGVIERRPIGFDSNETYKSITTKPFDSNGAMKFWKE